MHTLSESRSPIARLLSRKQRSGCTVTVCLPARNEEASVGPICSVITRRLLRPGLVDELLVLDDGSTDATAAEAARHGAQVVPVGDVLPWVSAGSGKGEVLWKSLWASSGDIVLWIDADIANFGSHFVTRLLSPLLDDPRTAFVKGHYRRDTGGGGGGRTTELAARPLISRYFPHLARFPQPLSGAFGGRREVLDAIPFVQGWGVDLGVLIDISRLVGLDRIAPADLGLCVHHSKPLLELGPQAMAVQSVLLRRAGVEADAGRSLVGPTPASEVLLRPGDDGEIEVLEVPVSERPPMRELPGYATRHLASVRDGSGPASPLAAVAPGGRAWFDVSRRTG